MALRKLLLVPDAPGYTSTDGNELVSTQLDGGFPRVRRDKLGAPKSVSVTWTMNPRDYEYFRAFFNTALQKGREPFLCNLLSEDGTGAVEHTCRIVPGTMQSQPSTGLTYIQTCQLTVKPLPVDDALNENIILVYEQSSGNPDRWINLLAHVALVTLPEYFDAES